MKALVGTISAVALTSMMSAPLLLASTYAEGSIPTLQKHLHRAQSLQRHPSG